MAYTCNVCDKSFDHAGAKNLHERWCRLLRLEKEQREVLESPKTLIVGTPKQVPTIKPDPCDHEWKLLGNSPVEKYARANGYTKYCGKCEECE